MDCNYVLEFDKVQGATYCGKPADGFLCEDHQTVVDTLAEEW